MGCAGQRKCTLDPMAASIGRCHDGFDGHPNQRDARHPARITVPAGKGKRGKIMTKILIGVDGSERSEDAVAFGRALALAAELRSSWPWPTGQTRFAPAPRNTRPSCARTRNARSPVSPPRSTMSATSSCDRWSSTRRPRMLSSDRRAGGRRHHRGRLEPHRPARTGPAREHRRAAAARGALPGRGRAARLPNPRDTVASGGRLRLPLDRGRRGRAWRRRGTRPRAVRPAASDAGHRTAGADLRRR